MMIRRMLPLAGAVLLSGMLQPVAVHAEPHALRASTDIAISKMLPVQPSRVIAGPDGTRTAPHANAVRESTSADVAVASDIGQTRVAPAGSTLANRQPIDVWAALRDSFRMPACPAPSVRRARRETRNAAHFEKLLRDALPTIDFIARVARDKGVAGEFVMMPWVESHFRNIRPRPGRAAGMWQIMAITARALHLPVSRAYDGRLDRVAATRAALDLLAGYYRHWHDWRLASMAYNTGEYRMRRIIGKHGKPPASPAIPRLPVGSVTRGHLTKLLAIACVIRDPQRFGVTLPELNPKDRLQVVTLPDATTVAAVARDSGLSMKRFRHLNPGYRGAHITSGMSRDILLPTTAARQLADAMPAMAPAGKPSLVSVAEGNRYTVQPGDSLWLIAQRFDVDVPELLRWNALDSARIEPGQHLVVDAPSG